MTVRNAESHTEEQNITEAQEAKTEKREHSGTREAATVYS